MTRPLTGALALMALLAGPAAAQGDFSGGSFDDGGGTAPAAGQGTGAVPPPLPPVQPGAQPPVQQGGAGSFDNGSFGPATGPAAGQVTGVTPPPPPPPPETTFGPSDVTVAPPPPPPADQQQQQPPVFQPPVQQQQQPPVDQNGAAAQLAAFETRDFGVPPTQALRQGEFHAPTPTAIPGAQLITTANLANAMNQGVQMLVIDVLGGQYALPNAYPAGVMAQGGDFSDRVQQQTVQWLQQVTGGQKGVPIVIYCSDPMCWLSYNASLRAVNAGYTNVYWYRGGVQAWQMAGLPTQPGGY
jgi:rhodanese-related sulfurtransferase